MDSDQQQGPGRPPASAVRDQLLNKVKALIIASGKSQGQVAEAMGVSRNWLSGWLNRRNGLSLSDLNKLCDQLNLEAPFRQSLVREFYPEAGGEALRSAVQRQLGANEVWIVAPHLRLADDTDLLSDLAHNIAAGVRYIFISGIKASLLLAARLLEEQLLRQGTGSGVEVRFVAGPAWLNLSAWRVKDPHRDDREVARLAINESELRLKAGDEGTVVRGALAHEVCKVFGDALADLDKEGSGFSLIYTISSLPGEEPNESASPSGVD